MIKKITQNSPLGFFHKNGYLIIKNLIPKKNIKEIYSTLDTIIKKSKYNIKYKNIKTKNLLKKISSIIIYIKKKDPKFASEIYEIFKVSLALNKFLDKKFFNTLSKKIKIDAKNLVNQQSIIRFDMPEEKKTIIDYHQDYMNDFNTKKNRFIGFTVWCPLNEKVNNFYGGIEILKESHKLGWKTTKKESKKKIYKAAKFIIDKKIINTYKTRAIIPSLKGGDVVVMDTRLIHKSVQNYSSICRFTAQFRYGLIGESKILN